MEGWTQRRRCNCLHVLLCQVVSYLDVFCLRRLHATGDPAEDLRELFAARGVAASVDDSAAFVDTALDHTRAVAAAAPPWLVAAFDHAAASTTSSSQTANPAVQTSSHLLDKPLLDSRMVRALVGRCEQ
eukprot:scaffold704_cov347-Prasinococcus_capsulatus_cf.AAC.30